MERNDIERSIIKTYRSILWRPFVRAVQEFLLVSNGDSIAVCVSGGKDSLLLAKLMQELKNHSDTVFSLRFIAMNPGFADQNLTALKNNCEHLGIPLEIFDSNIFAAAKKIGGDNPCYMCARMRRGFLYSTAQKLGCNKIALGHHFDDVIETTLLNLLYASNFSTMLPKLKSQNFPGIELIRPMVYIKEASILKYTKNAGINPMDCGCTIGCRSTPSKRREIKSLIASLKAIHKDVDKSIFTSAKNVNLNAVLGWKQGDERFDYLDFYDDFKTDEKEE